MKHFVLVVVVVLVTLGCTTSSQSSSSNAQVTTSSQTSIRLVPYNVPNNSFNEVFESTIAVLESIDAEIVDSELEETAAMIIARRHVANKFDDYGVVLTIDELGVIISLTITSGDSSRTIDSADFDTFWVLLWEDGDIMTFEVS